MGPSGAGKSTLLDLIADRKLIGCWSGDILINQYPRSLWFNRESAYVLQDDVHIGILTVEETLRFAAWTRLEEGTSVEAREQRVKTLLEMVGLTHVKDSLVGDALRKGISGGQLKRLSIAVEIVSLPNLIFLDGKLSFLSFLCKLILIILFRTYFWFGQFHCVGSNSGSAHFGRPKQNSGNHHSSAISRGVCSL